MRRIATALTALALIGGVVTPALAAPCKDARGRFIRCPPAHAAPAPRPARCKDSHGRFIRCPR